MIHTLRPPLREGFTTGSAATAAAAAALLLLLDAVAVSEITIPLPPDSASTLRPGTLNIPVAAVRQTAHGACAEVIKDGGDDPDATHQAHICVDLCADLHPGLPTPPLDTLPELLPELLPEIFSDPDELRIDIEGGEGVGRVTLPGLPVAIGCAAINPAPQAQIRLALRTLCADRGLTGRISLIIRVPDGALRATHTLNPRLGIVGGISILGTRGTVRPYSHEAWKQTISQAVSVAAATGCSQLGLTSGRRSERLLQLGCPDWPPQAFIQAADFIGFAVRAAVPHGFAGLTWSCFCGKLVKVAAGHPHTHAHTVAMNMAELARQAAQAGLAPHLVTAIRTANTAAQAFDIALDDPAAPRLLSVLLEQAQRTLTREAQAAATVTGMTPPPIAIRLFHLDGRELARTGDPA